MTRIRTIKIGNYYKHFKGYLCKVIDIVYDSESNNDEELKKVVVYEEQYGKHLKWARPYDMFNSLVDKNKYPNVKQKYRFQEIKNVKNS